MCSHHLVGNDADGPPANRLRKRTHQAHFIDSTTLPSTHEVEDDRLDGVFDVCFTGDSDSSNDSSNKEFSQYIWLNPKVFLFPERMKRLWLPSTGKNGKPQWIKRSN